MKWVKILGSAVFLTAVTVFAGNTVQAQDVLEQQVQERVKNQGWSWENGWFYYDEAGNRVTGWKKIGQYWYYFEEANSENPGLMVGNEKRD